MRGPVMSAFHVLVILSCTWFLFIILPSHYFLYMKSRGLKCSTGGHNYRGMRSSISAEEKIQKRLLTSKKVGTPDESTIFVVPRHHQPPFVAHVKVVNRNKFEALFRDHGSCNPLPVGLTDSDQLVNHEYRERYTSLWDQFYQDINRYQLYSFNSTHMMTSLMTYLQDTPMSLCSQMTNRAQIKLNITFTDGGKAVMKPWRVPREYQTLPDHYFFDDIERHTAELASFHLDRILDFRRVPPITGRIFNVTSEIKQCASGKVFVKSFFTSPANNTCFTTDCKDYCEVSKTPVCGKPELLEGTVEVFLPQEKELNVKSWIHPWSRNYTNGTEKHKWETNSSYCHSDVMLNPPYTQGRRLLDLIDMSIFDFLIGNSARQCYHTFQKLGLFTSLIHLDQGLAFGNYQKDDLSSLAALTQCCFVRNSTYNRLLLLNKDEYKLGDVMRESMSTDPISPVLYEPHYDALNRRLRIIIDVIDRCLARASSPDIVLKREPRIEDF